MPPFEGAREEPTGDEDMLPQPPPLKAEAAPAEDAGAAPKKNNDKSSDGNGSSSSSDSSSDSSRDSGSEGDDGGQKETDGPAEGGSPGNTVADAAGGDDAGDSDAGDKDETAGSDRVAELETALAATEAERAWLEGWVSDLEGCVGRAHDWARLENYTCSTFLFVLQGLPAVKKPHVSWKKVHVFEKGVNLGFPEHIYSSMKGVVF